MSLDVIQFMLHTSHHLCSIHSQVIHSLRASHIAFADPEGGDFFACKEYCIDTNEHGLTDDACIEICDKKTNDDDLACIDKCRKDALLDSKPKRWDVCFCECTQNCMSKGPGLEHTEDPTSAYTRPPIGTSSPVSSMPSSVPSPAPQSTQYDALE